MSESLSKGELRRQQILQVMKQNGRITISEIIDRFECSEATARRDLDLMERKGELIRTIGGALLEGPGTVREVSFDEKRQLLWLEKEAIARRALDFIEEGDSICLTGGTTTFLLARLLKQRQGITVVTNAVNIAMELSDCEGIQVVVIGGVMRSNSFELCGPLAERTIEHLNIEKLFMGIDGFSTTKGITTYSELEAQTARMLMRQAQQTFAVFDHTKVGKASLFTVTTVDGLTGCITDSLLPDDMVSTLQQMGVSCYYAGDEQ
ncbi:MULTISPECIES: DeoR/GlpR family DNA-binding transcription regulator [Paenibacillus]|uniref:DeoR/GlpR family DNA-binding transcription regulator n=1 Tax=Paenibacillus alvei TaxID=44250 RepID=A0ABT4E2C6_PAEAL|nr:MULTISPECIES: DeoR/GlpR family DNA-binding transcription regulator [Paenibacillus]EPY14814.1 DeoR family transcriptional regulator [Paenibacillus alvei A6-6i-x]MCY9527874.1 DeoR/GlpR family DNA-binding transcription regulator [Paenibacillus alvei]SDF36880.1 transcriptional regulator, DeoR family [Paenibacillus sp. cl6col]